MDALEEERQAVVTTNFLFMVELLKAAGMDANSLIGTGLSADSARKAARDALAKVAASFKIAPEKLYSRVESVSNELAPVGFPQSPTPGRLRRLLHRLQWFRDDMVRWANVEPSEMSQTAKFLAECCAQTLTLATDRLGNIDPKLLQLKDLIISDSRTDELRKAIARLSWLADGWDYICQLWEDSRDEPDDMQRLAICEMGRIAPAIPLEELATNDNIDEDMFNTVQRRWVRPNQDWRTGGLDYDLVRRIESVKAKIS